MRKETTPYKVTNKIIELSNQLVHGSEAKFVKVIPQTWSLPSECFPNVERMVKECGGKQVYGWAIWQWANILVEAEAHAIWESPEGEYVDITPHNGEKEILFLTDYEMRYENNTIANVRKAITTSPLVAELIQLMDERDQILCSTTGKTYTISEELYRKIMHIQMILHTDVGRNDPCPCQSGIKYKHCCAKL